MTRPRLLFYCQHSLGLGHLARSLTLAEALTADFDVTLLNGGRFPAGTRLPEGVRVLSLPPLGHDADYQLVSLDPRWSVAAAREERRRTILHCLETTTPAVLLVELFPFGRKKFAFELLPLLEAARARRRDRPVVLCSLRDILVRGRRDQSGHDERACRLANTYFDGVLVHSDPRFARLEETFTPRTPLRIPVAYTGFVAPPPVPPGREVRQPRLLVSAGGGMVGEPLVREAVRQHAALAAAGLDTTVVGGPFLPEPTWQWLVGEAATSPHLHAVRHVDDLCLEMSRSALSLSQAGYNTTMDILGSGTPAVVVPYGEGREDEQAARARRLAGLGALRVLDADRLSAQTFLDAVRDALDWAPLPVPLELDGRTRTSELLRTLRPARDVEAAP